MKIQGYYVVAELENGKFHQVMLTKEELEYVQSIIQSKDKIRLFSDSIDIITITKEQNERAD